MIPATQTSASPGPPTLPERAWRTTVLAAGIALAATAAQAAPASDCTALGSLQVHGITIVAAALVGPGAVEGVTLADAACRITGVARPVAGSNIGFEVWLPARGWNGRYYQLGNGGFGGTVHAPSLAAEVARGNAAASSDTGHRGDAFDASWASNDIAVIDYGERSIKATADAAAVLITAYYGRAADYRYFAGCSNGGRQALIAAQRYPDDWEGIVAGAPAHRWTAQLSDFAAIQHRLRHEPGGWLPPSKLPAIARAARAACVGNDPTRCRFDPVALRCRGAEHSACLTAGQIASVRLIQARGFEATEATTPDGWERWIVNPDTTAPTQLTFATQAFRYLLADRPNWTAADHPPVITRRIGNRSVQAILDASDGDLSAFAARGGRLLSYFGWADAVLSPAEGLNWYRRVANRVGDARMRRFYRLFMVPGMAHCQGGRGATSFGQSPAAPAGRADRRHDVRRALEAWVEHGIAPSRLIATGYGQTVELMPAPVVLKPVSVRQKMNGQETPRNLP